MDFNMIIEKTLPVKDFLWIEEKVNDNLFYPKLLFED